MKLSQFNQYLNEVDELTFVLPDGNKVPTHFHVTEVGLNTKHVVDCGGTVHVCETIRFQLWTANDPEHRLAPQKLKRIIAHPTPIFKNKDLPVEFEYQMETIGLFGLSFDDNKFWLTPKHTSCLATDLCGIPSINPQAAPSKLLTTLTPACTPGTGCC
jgi:hypothetical protein